ncbi:ALI_HP2_G0026140.mRNA.1.CDS.1 [Saccharomyces cerevisiae]|nr:ALI_HP2_G0026140.mRNA.1.CDS.1 [Saccharomyces cerevisiae]CAI6557527.1 ALI_HP2_G0026140.mRNA.1.CDS.1 [Saccharomyces cerevisiae]
MNVLQFLDFGLTKIETSFLYGIDVYLCPEGVFTQYGLCKAVKRCSALMSGWPESIVSEDGFGKH